MPGKELVDMVCYENGDLVCDSCDSVESQHIANCSPEIVAALVSLALEALATREDNDLGKELDDLANLLEGTTDGA